LTLFDFVILYMYLPTYLMLVDHRLLFNWHRKQLYHTKSIRFIYSVVLSKKSYYFLFAYCFLP